MSYLDKKDIDILLEAGFAEEDLGLVPGGKRGVEIYETPGDYFAKELIENACEQGECDLLEEILPSLPKEPYDNSRMGLYEEDEYPGNEDISIDVPSDLRNQVNWLSTIKIGKMSLWQRRDGNSFDWPVKRVNVEIPEKEKERMKRLNPDDKKELWKSYAKAAWRNLWSDAVSTLYNKHCELITIGTKKKYNLIIIDADDMREIGHRPPGETQWVTLMYFDKDNIKPQIRPRTHL
jgi:hypothetical protein